MRKGILSIIIIILVIIFVTPALMGQYLHYDLVKKFKQTKWPMGYQVKLSNYKAGWLTSKADITIKSTGNGAIAKQTLLRDKESLEFNITIYHGPLTFATNMQGNTQIFFGQAILKGNAKLIDFPLKLFAKIYFNGSVDANVLNNGYMHKGEKTTLTMQGFTGSFAITKAWQNMHGETTVKGIQITNNEDQDQIIVPSVKTEFNQQWQIVNGSGMWVGSRTDNIEKMDITKAKTSMVKVNNIEIHSQSELINESLNYNIDASVGSIAFAGIETMGPGVLKYQLKHMQAKNLLALKDLMEKTGSTVAKEGESAVALQEMLHTYARLLSGTSQELQELSLKTPEGDVYITGHLRVPKLDVDNAQNNPLLVGAMYTALVLNSKAQLMLQLPEHFALKLLPELAQQAGQPYDAKAKLQQLQAVGMVTVNDDGNVIMQFSYENGRAQLNGQPIAQVIQRYRALQQAPVQQPTQQQQPAQPSASAQQQAPGQQLVPTQQPAMQVTPAASTVPSLSPTSNSQPTQSTPQSNPSNSAIDH